MDRRRYQKARHVAGDAAVALDRGDTSPAFPSRAPAIRPERALSVDAVMDDMRAILWPDDRNPVTAGFDPASNARRQDKPPPGQD
jgi:hypothetical protein